jgi:hypothetical protein
MDDAETAHRPAADQPHSGPPDLILQAIVPPPDAPAEIRAAVAHTLARRTLTGDRAYTWEDVTFAASALALVKGTIQRAVPDTQWVFALRADSPRLGEQLRSTGDWASTLHRHGARAADRDLWGVSVFHAITSSPRRTTNHSG